MLSFWPHKACTSNEMDSQDFDADLHGVTYKKYYTLANNLKRSDEIAVMIYNISSPHGCVTVIIESTET